MNPPRNAFCKEKKRRLNKSRDENRRERLRVQNNVFIRRLPRRYAPRNDAKPVNFHHAYLLLSSHLECHCERSEAISSSIVHTKTEPRDPHSSPLATPVLLFKKPYPSCVPSCSPILLFNLRVPYLVISCFFSFPVHRIFPVNRIKYLSAPLLSQIPRP